MSQAKRPLVVEIHGTGTHNKGAELMACAIRQHLNQRYPDAKIVVPLSWGSFEERSALGFRTNLELVGRLKLPMTRLLRPALHALPWSLAERIGLTAPDSVDLVLDASGFSFSDQWGPSKTKFMLSKMLNRKRRNQPLILLPQALGPFNEPQVASYARRLMDRATLIFARDETSLKHLQTLCPKHPGIRSAPDFTCLVEPEPCPSLELSSRHCAIVPNARMLDKTGRAEDYLRALGEAISAASEGGLEPVWLIHDSREDSRVTTLVDKGQHLRTITHSNPAVLKWVLGRSSLVIGSRYHALIGSMDQGVPTIGMGWSHKYPELFNDYGLSRGLIGDIGDLGKLRATILDMCVPDVAEKVKHQLHRSAKNLRARCGAMWSEVDDEIEKVLTGI